MPKVLGNLDLNKNELQNAIIHPRDTAPSNPKTGQFYYNTSDNNLYRYDGSNWISYQNLITAEGILEGDGEGNITAVDTASTNTLEIDSTVTSGSSHLITSGAVYTAISQIEGGGSGIETETDPFFTASPAAGITQNDINSWDAKVSDDKTWNGVTLDKTGTISSSSMYLAARASTDATTAYQIQATSTPSSQKIAMYNSNLYLSSTTPSANDNSTKVATTAYVDGAISNLGSVLTYKGTKAAVSNLPTTGNTTGDVWHITADGSEYAWDGSNWQELGTAVDLSGYVPTSRKVNGKALSSDITLSASDVGAADSSHAHGNITSGGDITATAPTIANGDQLIINDHSASEITNGPTFDGSTTTSYLSKKGTWETPSIPKQGTWYGTCSTAASTAQKDVTCSGFELTTGNVIGVLFTTANTAATPTLNINSTTAKSIYIGNSTPSSTTNVLKWSANTMVYFMYDGTYYRYITSVSAGSVIPSRGANTWYGTSSTGATTQAKTSTIENFVLTQGAIACITFSTANTYSSAKITLNINSTGAKDIYYNNAVTSSTNPLLWDANETLTFIYSGSYYYFVSRTNYTETDPTVPSWAKASTKPSYTASEVGAIAAPSSPSSGNILSYNGTTWVASAPVSGLPAQSSSTNGQYLISNGTSGAAWSTISGFKTTQSTVNSPSPDGTSMSFIDTITQNTNGVITATKKSIDTDAVSGISIDSTPTLNSTNLVYSGGVYTALSGKQNSLPSQSGNSGKFLTTNGSSISWANTPQTDISGKTDKVSGATNGNFAALDSNGNLTDSGHKHSDYLTSHQDITGKANLASPAFTGTPTAPTAALGTDTTQIATTAFVNTVLENKITYGTTDLTAGVSTLAEGTIYLVYE